MPAPLLDKNTIYWLEDPAGVHLPLIAGEAEYRAQSSELCFYDTERPHALPAKFIRGDVKTGLQFDSPDRKIVVRKLDRASFEKVFRPLVSGAPAFKTDADVQNFYRTLIRNIGA